MGAASLVRRFTFLLKRLDRSDRTRLPVAASRSFCCWRRSLGFCLARATCCVRSEAELLYVVFLARYCFICARAASGESARHPLGLSVSHDMWPVLGAVGVSARPAATMSGGRCNRRHLVTQRSMHTPLEGAHLFSVMITASAPASCAAAAARGRRPWPPPRRSPVTLPAPQHSPWWTVRHRPLGCCTWSAAQETASRAVLWAVDIASFELAS